MLRAIAILFLCISVTAESLPLEWLPRDGAVSYSLYYGAPNYTNRIITTGTSATVSGLVPGATYHFAVTATDSLGRETEPFDALAYHVPMVNVTVVSISGAGTVTKSTDLSGPWTWLADFGPYGELRETNTIEIGFYTFSVPKELCRPTINAVKQ